MYGGVWDVLPGFLHLESLHLDLVAFPEHISSAQAFHALPTFSMYLRDPRQGICGPGKFHMTISDNWGPHKSLECGGSHKDLLRILTGFLLRLSEVTELLLVEDGDNPTSSGWAKIAREIAILGSDLKVLDLSG